MKPFLATGVVLLRLIGVTVRDRIRSPVQIREGSDGRSATRCLGRPLIPSGIHRRGRPTTRGGDAGRRWSESPDEMVQLRRRLPAVYRPRPRPRRQRLQEGVGGGGARRRGCRRRRGWRSRGSNRGSRGR